MNPILSVEGVSKRFGGIVAVRGVDLVVQPGELLGLFGPNGAGKTTLFNLVAGVFPPDVGRIRLDGQDITRVPAFRRAQAGIGRTFQICRPFRSLTVVENVLATIPRTGATGPHDGASAAQVLDLVGLGGRAHHPASRLTLGMLKRLEVARALALEPKLLLLDEPLAGLTGGETNDLLAAIATLKARTTIVLIDHNVRQSLTVCDRAVVMDAGAVIAAGTPDEIRRDPRVRRAYLGEEAA
jgi:branched-chain amino acid transport system ATP-binding protein